MPTIDEISRRHAFYYEAMLGAIFEMYKFSGIMGVGLFDLYRENILRGWSWAIDNSSRHRDAAELCVSFACDRSELLNLRLESAQVVRRLRSSLACAKRLGDVGRRGRLLREIGATQAVNGEVEQSFICYLRSEEICREASDKEGEAMALCNQGKAYAQLHNNTAAIHCLERSLRIFREIECTEGEADALSVLGTAQLGLGIAETAVASYERSLEICRKIDNYRIEAIALCGLGAARMALDQSREAAELFAAALVLFRQLKDQQGEARVLCSISSAAGDRANTEFTIQDLK